MQEVENMAKATKVRKAAEALGRGGYCARVCVPAPMPVQCPHCRSSRTTAANGVHYNAHFAVRYEHRVCGVCGYTFTASRRMTEEELARRSAKTADCSVIREQFS